MCSRNIASIVAKSRVDTAVGPVKNVCVVRATPVLKCSISGLNNIYLEKKGFMNVQGLSECSQAGHRFHLLASLHTLALD
jgi:hypothetical protein